MPERPILIFPTPESVPKPKGHGGGSPLPPPTNREGQAQRIEAQFAKVQAAFVSDEPGDVERVLVMETSSQIDGLQTAVQRVPGLEWLSEMDVENVELHNLYDEKTDKQIKGGRFYILSSNKQATERLLRLWKHYQSGKRFEHGLGAFGRVFKYLLTLRRWDTRDRLRDTGILKKWKNDYKIKVGTNSSVNFEIELHYQTNGEERDKKLRNLIQEIESMRGSVGQTTCIEDIAFHALKAALPIASIEQVVRHDWEAGQYPAGLPSIFNSEAVRYFRPIGQHVDGSGEPSMHSLQRDLSPIEVDKAPVLALLDGLPLLGHTMLDGRIYLSDPDRYRDDYQPSEQRHGTAMASLICHGDLSRPSAESKSLPRRIYVRPIMKPDQERNEEIPSEFFQEDIVERAVREMLEGDNPMAPNIRIINLSLGNLNQQYLNQMSPWARLLDWLSFKYNVLFIVSAGNYTDPIQWDDSDYNADYAQINIFEDDKRRPILFVIDKKQRNHRLLSPAESMNALTVGALQGDACGDFQAPHDIVNPIKDMELPAPYSRIGPGYNSAVKPDIFARGGRLLYRQELENENSLEPVSNNDPPGIQVAYPGAMPEHLNNTAYEVGTSHAAAMVSHGAGHIFEVLEELRAEYDGDLDTDFDAVLVKTLLVHGVSHGKNKESYQHLQRGTNKQTFKRYLSRYLGYGNIDIERVLECTRSRATAIGHGRIQAQQRYCFNFPLSGISSVRDYARLTVTLAWLSPINPHHIGMRKAKLFFENKLLKKENGHKRKESDWQQVRKGTVQHEIFELNKDNLPGESLDLFVQCDEGAGTLDDEIRYGLAVTLEVAKHEKIDLYEMVKEGIKQPVRAGSR